MPTLAWVRAGRAPMTTLWVPSPHARRSIENERWSFLTFVGLPVADPDPLGSTGNFRSTSARFIRFVTTDQPTIGIARTIEEYRFAIIWPDHGLRGLTPIRFWSVSRS
jgi:hypothetical protein